MTQFELSVRSCVQALAQSAPKVGDLLHFWEITLRTVSSIYALISEIELTFPYCLYFSRVANDNDSDQIFGLNSL